MITQPPPDSLYVSHGDTPNRNTEPIRSRRTPGLTSICATLAFLLTLSAGTPVFAQDPAPAIADIRLLHRPVSGDTFDLGERITALVTFDKQVAVTGNPRLVLWMGDQPRSADLQATRDRGGRTDLLFSHYVEASDRDDDGIGIPANALRLNRGSIRDSAGNDADLTHEAVPDDPERKVDGQLDSTPTIRSVFVSPPPDGTFRRGHHIVVTVRFSARVDVTGTPQLTLQVGAEARQADLHAWRGSTLTFEYIVQSHDVDEDGIGVPADALTLNGGSITDAGGSNDADLTHEALPDDPARKVDGAGDVVPTVRRVVFLRSPGSQSTYAAGETIFVQVSFTHGVHVTGAPQLALQVGAQTRRADYLPRLRAAEMLPPISGFHTPEEDVRTAYFRYIVQPSDVDDDGVSVPANALTLNGGSIRAIDGNRDARLGHDGVADDPTRKVDGSRVDDQAPGIIGFYMEPPTRGTFGRGDVMTPRLSLNEVVTVTGAPRLALRIGAQTRFATFRETWGSATLLFEYVVEESDRDSNGISVAGDAVDLNGGTIRDNAGNDVSLDLGHLAFNDNPDYRVDGRLTPVPALPLGGILALVLALIGGGWRRLARERDHRARAS